MLHDICIQAMHLNTWQALARDSEAGSNMLTAFSVHAQWSVIVIPLWRQLLAMFGVTLLRAQVLQQFSRLICAVSPAVWSPVSESIRTLRQCSLLVGLSLVFASASFHIKQVISRRCRVQFFARDILGSLALGLEPVSNVKLRWIGEHGSWCFFKASGQCMEM